MLHCALSVSEVHGSIILAEITTTSAQRFCLRYRLFPDYSLIVLDYEMVIDSRYVIDDTNQSFSCSRKFTN